MALSTEGVMRKAAMLGAGPYAIPNVQRRHLRHLHQQHAVRRLPLLRRAADAFATESHLDICAERLGLDPFEIRRINAMRDGAITHTKQKLGSVSLSRVLTPPKKALAGKRARRLRAAPTRAISTATTSARPTHWARVCAAKKGKRRR